LSLRAVGQTSAAASSLKGAASNVRWYESHYNHNKNVAQQYIFDENWSTFPHALHFKVLHQKRS
jgi:hypothetical protein